MTWYRHNSGQVTECHIAADDVPVVVIDPEDAERVERLWKTLGGARALQSRSNLAAALREFATPTPPKPDEPQGLGAVVEDAEGLWWIRVDTEGASWQRKVNHRASEIRGWPDIAAVRVLSEEVPA